MASALRVLSANLWSGGADPDAFAELVVALAVDVVAVQELSHEQAEALSAVMPYGQLDPDGGMGIALQRPGVVERVPVSGRDARAVRLNPADWGQLAAPIEIVNVHMAAPHVVRPWPGLLQRRVQVRELERYLSSSPNETRVLVGDFNATPSWPLYRRISSQFTDAAVAAAQTAGRLAAPTWGPWAGAPRLFRIDHGFVRGLRVEDFRVVDVAGSDHSAIVVDVIGLSSS